MLLLTERGVYMLKEAPLYIPVLLLLVYILFHEGEGIVVKNYGKKHGSGGMFFNAIICLFSMVFFFITDKDGLCFPKELWGYGIVSCLMFATGFYTMYIALKIGSFVASRLIASFSGVISVVYGIFILKEPATISTYVAIVLIFLSVFLRQSGSKKGEEDEKKGVSAKWLIMAILAAVSNGLIAVISRMQQLRFNNAYDNEFMIMSFGGSFIALLILGFIYERDNFKKVAKYGTVYGFLGGMCNGAKNFVNLVLYLYIPISVATPIKSGVGFIVSFFLSVFLYKEKFTKMQVAGVAVGILAIIMFKVDIIQMIINLFA